MNHYDKYVRKHVPKTKEAWARLGYLIALFFFALFVGFLALTEPVESEAPKQAKVAEPINAPILGVADPCGLDVVVCDSEAPQGRIEPTRAIVTAQPSASRPKSENEARIREIAKEIGMTQSQANLAVAIGYCESGLRTNALGDGGKSRGIWQIYSLAHPTITDAQAYDLEWSTRWALGKMKAGYWRLWSCHRIVTSR